ncbi:unnamed protein product [Candidula unifasciata]|uniref:Uroporphyrinogen-III synthase n=1 Tax=Candidula unifasciata TaxID=100452 RepID=A0A8S3ZZ87_9EUPU|nr:unnamed protein product [Candidula unifasciata]
MKKKTVFLFKSPKENEVDKFTESIEEAGFSCVTIPVLSFRFINQSLLRSHLSAIHLFSAIIFTSVRSVEAVVSVAKELETEKSIFQKQSFVVGNTTADAAKRSGFSPKGENSGNAKALAEFILHEVGPDKTKPLLYPCSNIHRDTLPGILTSHGLNLTEVVSYETCPNENMEEALREALTLQGLPDYAVFFSPSSFQYTQKAVAKDLLHLDNVKIIALGPATYKSVCDCGFTPFGMAEKPEPQSLLQLLS